mgnify:CR=1 FL=1
MLRRTCVGRILLVLTVGIVLLGAVSAWAQVKNVNTGETFTTIQAAVTAASSGDTIEVAAGTYKENVTINKALTLLSASGKDVTTCLLYTSPSPRDLSTSRMPSSA